MFSIFFVESSHLKFGACTLEYGILLSLVYIKIARDSSYSCSGFTWL